MTRQTYTLLREGVIFLDQVLCHRSASVEDDELQIWAWKWMVCGKKMFTGKFTLVQNKAKIILQMGFVGITNVLENSFHKGLFHTLWSSKPGFVTGCVVGSCSHSKLLDLHTYVIRVIKHMFVTVIHYIRRCVIKIFGIYTANTLNLP